MASLIVRDLHAFYGKAHILHGVSLQAEAGRVAGLLGRNGAGKTTLLRSVMRLGPEVSGEVRILDVDVSRAEADRIARMGVAFMPQGTRVFPRLSVRDNILVAAHAVSRPRTIREILGFLPELEPLLEQLAGTLSGGQQQLVGIGRSLAMRCRVLLMDEPTEGLMPRLVNHVGDLARQMAAEGVAVLLVEQNIHLAMNACDHLFIMEKGCVMAEGRPEDIQAQGCIDRFLGVDVMDETVNREVG